MSYDLVVIGAGWAGFKAAQRAEALGLKTAIVERQDLGGTCLNRGCIPTKALIQSAKFYSQAKNFASFGIKVNLPQIEFSQIQARKEKLVVGLAEAMQAGLKDIDFLKGSASFVSADTIKVDGRQLSARSVIIATGSEPAELPVLKFDGKKIVSSNELLRIERIPQSLLVVGGGVIGCEFASLFSALGSRVTLAEKMPQLLPGLDREVARYLEVAFKKRQVKLILNCDASGLNVNDYEITLVAVGRRPYLRGLGIEGLGIKIEGGRPVVDEYLRTNIPHIYAAGDCVCRLCLAHYAAYQGRIAAENIASFGSQRADNAVIPTCVFTDPEIACVGKLEDELLRLGREIDTHRFDFIGSGMARILGEVEGFIKIISDKKNSAVLGACIIGPRATELINVLTVAITNRLSIAQLKQTLFAHPTLSEAIGEALG